MRAINDILIELMQTMSRLGQQKRVERIWQGLENKRVEEPEWKPTWKCRNLTKWGAVERLMEKRPETFPDDVATLAKRGVATVY